jgi:hypothetical protein
MLNQDRLFHVRPFRLPARLQPVPGAPVTGATSRGTPYSGILPPGLTIDAPVAPDTGIPLSGPPGTAYPPLSPSPSRIRRATSAPDGHSFGEQALYDALWRHAHPYRDDARIITLGYRRMSDLARLTVNNCKANIQSLIQKLAVEEVASFTHSQGRTYLVFSETAILERRRAAALTHYIKSRGVVFVDPDTGEPLTYRIRDRSGIPFSGSPLSGTPSPELLEGLREFAAGFDPDAAALLWRECRRRAPGCTVSEILHFARAQTGARTDPNPAFLLAAVPPCFGPPPGPPPIS